MGTNRDRRFRKWDEKPRKGYLEVFFTKLIECIAEKVADMLEPIIRMLLNKISGVTVEPVFSKKEEDVCLMKRKEEK